MNPRFSLDKTFRSIDTAMKAKNLKRQNKKIPKSFYRENETAIYLGVTYNRKYLKVNTGFKVKPFYFDVSKQALRSNSSKYELLEISLNRIKERFVTSFHNARLGEEEMSVSDVKEMLVKAVDGSTCSDKDMSFFNVYDEFLKYKSRSIKTNTLHRYTHLKKLLIEYFEFNHAELTIDQINLKFADNFKFFLESEKGYAKNTIVKYLKQIKSFARFCLLNEYSQNQKFSLIKTTEDPSSVFVLNEQEIERIRQLKLDDNLWDEVRDAFCFLCYTGQRYSDLKNLKWKDIHEESKFTYWRLYQFKTADTQHINIPLIPKALELLEKRGCRDLDENVFRIISNQKMNKKLKRISKLAGISGKFTTIRKQGGKRLEIVNERWEKVTTHVGRKSFITNALKRGMPLQFVSRISGHKSEKSMRSYIYLSEFETAESLYEYFNEKSI